MADNTFLTAWENMLKRRADRATQERALTYQREALEQARQQAAAEAALGAERNRLQGMQISSHEAVAKRQAELEAERNRIAAEGQFLKGLAEGIVEQDPNGIPFGNLSGRVISQEERANRQQNIFASQAEAASAGLPEMFRPFVQSAIRSQIPGIVGLFPSDPKQVFAAKMAAALAAPGMDGAKGLLDLAKEYGAFNDAMIGPLARRQAEAGIAAQGASTAVNSLQAEQFRQRMLGQQTYAQLYSSIPLKDRPTQEEDPTGAKTLGKVMEVAENAKLPPAAKQALIGYAAERLGAFHQRAPKASSFIDQYMQRILDEKDPSKKKKLQQEMWSNPQVLDEINSAIGVR